MDKIRVMIIENDFNWMQVLSKCIDEENDMEVIEQIRTNADEQKIACTNIDIVLLDVILIENGNKVSGIEFASKLLQNGLQKIIFITALAERESILNSFDIGAANYVTKKSYKDIPTVIREVYNDNICIRADISKVLIDELRKERKVSVLSPAEREVYFLKEQGLNNRQISLKLYKSPDTVKKQVRAIRSKLK